MSVTDSLILVSWLAIGLLALGMAGLIRQMRILAQRLGAPTGGLGVFVQPDAVLEAGQQARLLLFLEPGCRACTTLLDGLSTVHGPPVELPLDVAASAVVKDPSGLRLPEPFEMIVDDGRLSELFAVRLTPFVVLFEREAGTLVRIAASSPTHVAQLLHRLESLSSLSNRSKENDKEMTRK